MPDLTDLEFVRHVLERHRAAILAEHRAVGVGIGKQEFKDPGFVITVFLESSSDRQNTATSIEGIPLKFVVTGQITPRR